MLQASMQQAAHIQSCSKLQCARLVAGRLGMHIGWACLKHMVIIQPNYRVTFTI